MSSNDMPMPRDTPLPSSFDDNADFYNEDRLSKIWRRLREEPLIPFGCALTCMALYGATKAMRSGNHEKTNMMFRRRIYAQGFTLLAMVAGSIYWQQDREKRKEFDEVVKEKKRTEKRDRWIAELEARDREEKMFKERLERGRRRERERQQEEKTMVDEAVGRVEDGAQRVEQEVEKTGRGVFDAASSLWGGKKS